MQAAKRSSSIAHSKPAAPAGSDANWKLAVVAVVLVGGPLMIWVSYAARSKVAVTVSAEVGIVSVQVVAAPQPPPLQPPKLAPAPGVAVSVTVEPAA